MRRVVIDMQNALFADAVAGALRRFDFDFDPVMSESPDKTLSLCDAVLANVLIMEVTAYTPWRFEERMKIRNELRKVNPDCKIVFVVDENTEKKLADKVRRAKKDGLIDNFIYGKKCCHHSPSIEESLLQDAVMRAIMQTAKQNIEVMKTLKIHIGMGLTDEVTEDKTLDIQIRIAEIDAEFQKMLKAVSADNADRIDEERITEMMNEKQRLTVQLEQYAAMRQKRESAKSRLDEIYTILDGLQNHPMEYDDKLVRQIIECVVVESKEKIKVVFIGGTEIEMTL